MCHPSSLLSYLTLLNSFFSISHTLSSVFNLVRIVVLYVYLPKVWGNSSGITPNKTFYS